MRSSRGKTRRPKGALRLVKVVEVREALEELEEPLGGETAVTTRMTKTRKPGRLPGRVKVRARSRSVPTTTRRRSRKSKSTRVLKARKTPPPRRTPSKLR